MTRDVRRLYLDSNVFIALFETNDRLSSAIMAMMTRGRAVSERCFVTSRLSLAEVVVKPKRSGDANLLAGYLDWLGEPRPLSRATLDVIDVDTAVLLSAGELRARHPAMKLPDAVHVATAMISGCSHVLSADLRLQAAATGDAAPRMLRLTADACHDVAFTSPP